VSVWNWSPFQIGTRAESEFARDSLSLFPDSVRPGLTGSSARALGRRRLRRIVRRRSRAPKMDISKKCISSRCRDRARLDAARRTVLRHKHFTSRKGKNLLAHLAGGWIRGARSQIQATISPSDCWVNLCCRVRQPRKPARILYSITFCRQQALYRQIATTHQGGRRAAEREGGSRAKPTFPALAVWSGTWDVQVCR